MKKKNRLLKIDDETRSKLEKTSRELAFLENQKVGMGEVVRRMSNVPGIKRILEEDARVKRRFR